MTQKERLVELLKDFDNLGSEEWAEDELVVKNEDKVFSEDWIDEEAMKELETYYNEKADYLLSNGVVVLRETEKNDLQRSIYQILLKLDWLSFERLKEREVK